MSGAPVNALDFNQFTGLRAQAQRGDAAALEKIAPKFEAMMIQQMLKSARAAGFGDELMGGGQTQFYQDMFDQQIAESMAAGKGIGIAEMLVQQLRGREAASTDVAASKAVSAVYTVPHGRAVASVSAASGQAASQDDFVAQALPAARHAAQQLGLPVEALVAQAAVHSGWGQREGNDVLGLRGDAAAGYPDLASAFDDYADYLQRQPRYADALAHGGDARVFMQRLQQAGYVTDPDYADKVMQVAHSARISGTPALASEASSGVAGPTRVQANAATTDTPEAFVAQILPHAERAAARLGVSSKVLVAQAALETGWGRHQMRYADRQPTFNFFGIKADTSWEGSTVTRTTREFEDGRMSTQTASFRAYESIDAAFDDYVDFLQSNPRYVHALRHGGSDAHFAGGLQRAGYATDPAYANKILRITQGSAMREALRGATPTQPTPRLTV